MGATTAIYALDYRSYYAQWHESVFTWTWLIQFAFTTAGATLQFAVSGLPLYFPLGFAGLAPSPCGLRASRVEQSTLLGRDAPATRNRMTSP